MNRRSFFAILAAPGAALPFLGSWLKRREEDRRIELERAHLEMLSRCQRDLLENARRYRRIPLPDELTREPPTFDGVPLKHVTRLDSSLGDGQPLALFRDFNHSPSPTFGDFQPDKPFGPVSLSAVTRSP